MRLIFTLLMFALLPMFGNVAVAAETAQSVEEGVFFEPTQADYDKSWKAIGEQQAAYVAAKTAGNFQEAQALALFHFQKAWLYNNEGFALINKAGNWQNKEALTSALALFKAALAAADESAHHENEVEACRAKATKNLAAVKTQLENLNK